MIILYYTYGKFSILYFKKKFLNEISFVEFVIYIMFHSQLFKNENFLKKNKNEIIDINLLYIIYLYCSIFIFILWWNFIETDIVFLYKLFLIIWNKR